MSMINKGPSIRTFSNDTEMIDHINQISGNSFITIADALAWVNGQNDYYIQNIEAPTILTEDLILYVDAGQVSSMPKGGTTWYDLSTTQAHGTLINNAQWATRGNGSVVYDSNGDYVNCPSVPININAGEGNTVEQWLYWTGGSGEMTFSFGGAELDLYITIGTLGFNNGNALLYGIPFSEYSNKWTHITAFFPSNWGPSTYEDAKLWVNGIRQNISILSGSVVVEPLVTPSDIIIGSGFGSNPVQYSFGGNIASTKLYARELNDEEVYLNYLGSVNRFFDWILVSGNWDDSSIWIDEETW